MTSEQVFAILKKLINSGGITPEQIKEAVDDYINQNGLPITPASEAKINQLISTALQSYATNDSVNTKLENYATSESVNNGLSSKVDTVEGMGLSSNDYTDAEKLKLAGLENYDDTDIKASIVQIEDNDTEQDTVISELQTAVSANTEKLNVLNGEGAGSVKKQIADGVAKIVAGAPEDFDTLKEMSDWISQHSESAAAMNSQIQDNTSDIADLETNKADKSDIPTSLPANGGNADTVGGKSAEELTQSNQNLLINPDFKINQRGKSEYLPNADTYSADRWFISTKAKVSVEGDGVKITATAETDRGWLVIAQRMEPPLTVGKTYTISFYVNEIVGTSWYFDYNEAKYGILTGGLHTFTFVAKEHSNPNNGGANAPLIAFGKNHAVGDSIVIKWMKLEEGSVATPFIPPNPMTEILKCRPISDEEQKLLNGAGKWVDIPANGEIRSIDVELGSDCNELIGKNGSVTTYRLRGTSFVNTPSGLPTFQGTLIAVNFMPGWIKQIFVSAHVGRTFFRYYDNGWSEWEESISKKALEKDLEHLNLLDNPDFKINQRGKTLYDKLAGRMYTLDRWFSYAPGSVDSNIEIVDTGLKMTVHNDSNTNTYNTILAQILDCDLNKEGHIGKKLTLSIFVSKEPIGNWLISLRFGKGFPEGEYNGVFVSEKLQKGINSVTCTVPNGAVSVRACIMTDVDSFAGDTLYAERVKLEFSDHQTLGYQKSDGTWIVKDPAPNPALELLKCQRYYQYLTIVQYGRYLVGQIYSNAAAYLWVPTPTRLRAVPTIITDIDSIRLVGSDGKELGVSKVELTTFNSIGIMIKFSLTDPVVPGVCCILGFNQTRLELNAEL